MESQFHLNISVPGKVIIDQDVSSLIVPAEKGYMGILAHHAPIIAKLKPGKIAIGLSDGKILNINLTTGGFMEVSDNMATLILDAA